MKKENFEQVAKQSLAKYTKTEENFKTLLLQPDRAIFLAEKAEIILKIYKNSKTLEREHAMMEKVRKIGVPVPKTLGLEVKSLAVLTMEYVKGTTLNSDNTLAAHEAGKYLKMFHSIGAKPPFSGGQNDWNEFISWWSNKEVQNVKKLNVFSEPEIQKIENEFINLLSLLTARPIVMLHGDLQAEHIIVDAKNDKLLAFIDFADAQAGDPLLDIAVLSLWDKNLANLILGGYEGIDNNEQTQNILSGYRLLRHIAVIPWLTNRGLQERAEKSITTVRKSL